MWGCCYTNIIDFMYIRSRVGYHKNAIIFLIALLLVGISDCSLLELLLLIARTMWSLYSCFQGFVCPNFHVTIMLVKIAMCVVTYIQMNVQSGECHAFFWLLRSYEYVVAKLMLLMKSTHPSFDIMSYNISHHKINFNILRPVWFGNWHIC